MDLMALALVCSIIAVVYAVFLLIKLRMYEIGNERMRDISDQIREGAMAFLNKEYQMLVFFIIIVSLALLFGGLFGTMEKPTVVAFIVGAVFSALAGNIGMRVATSANARTAQATRKGIDEGLRVAFKSGSVMGLMVVGLGLLGITVLYFVFDIGKGNVDVLYGFGFGASSIALFARVGGGIYTKSADVGADLVGKVEAGIPEDDPRNPAVIADNVGDNVGDVAGMGADLFESYVDSIIAAMALGFVATFASATGYQRDAAILPVLLAGLGILCSVAGIWVVQFLKGKEPNIILNMGTVVSAVLMAVFSYFIISSVLGDLSSVSHREVYFSLLVGLAAGLTIGFSTEFFTSEKQRPTKSIAEASATGAATNIIAGLSVGMLSTVPPVLAVSVAIGVSYHLTGMYGIGIAAVGMLSILGMTLATDTYGPVADNAAGIAEMAGLGKEVRERAEALDAVGNTTAAIGKGFAIGSAGLTALALFSTFKTQAKIESIDVSYPPVLIGLLIGALLPFIFSALTMNAVGRAAMAMVEEVRRQFKEIPGLKEGKEGVKPDSRRCVEISTHSALKEMILPGVLTVAVPIAVGFVNVEALGGLLAGAVATGFLLAVLMANAGGAWDNAKKYIEAGNLGGKGSETHKAAVVGDTVGDPFKDTSGPSLNILIKLMSIVALVFLPFFV